MKTVRVTGHVDRMHRLSAKVPDSIPPGPVTVLVVRASQEDDAEHAWMTGVALEWADDLTDVRQDIYTLADGEPVDEP